MWQDYWQIGLIVLLLAMGYGFGSLAERRHYRSILRREDEFRDFVTLPAKRLPEALAAPETRLVLGSVVISVDYFKRALAALRMIFGGRLTSYESLIDRARREALLRMQEAARRIGAEMVFGVRFETSAISRGGRGGIGSVEVLAYGTAVVPAARQAAATDR